MSFLLKLTPEQNQSIRLVQSIKNIRYKHADSMIEVVVGQLIHNFLQGQSTVVITSNQAWRNKISDLCQAVLPTIPLLIIQDEDKTKSEIYAYFRSKYEGPKSVAPSFKAYISEHMAQDWLTKVNEAIDSTIKKSHKQKTNRLISYLSDRSKNVVFTQIINILNSCSELDKTELWSQISRESIQEAAQKYPTVSSTYNEWANNLWSQNWTEERTTCWYKEIPALIADMEALLNEYHAFFNEYLQYLSKMVYEEFWHTHTLITHYKAITHAWIGWKSSIREDGSIWPIFKKSNNPFQELSSFINETYLNWKNLKRKALCEESILPDKLLLLIKEDPNKGMTWLEALEKELYQKYIYNKGNVHSLVLKSNKANLDKNFYWEGMDKVFDISKRIEDLHIFDHKISVHTQYFKYQAEWIAAQMEKLSTVWDILDNHQSEINWYSYINQQAEIKQKIFLSLESIPPADWTNMWDAVGDYFSLGWHSAFESTILDLAYTEYIHWNEDVMHSQLIDQEKERYVQWVRAIDDMQKKDKDLYKAIFKSKSKISHLSLDYIMEKHADIITKIYPILMCDRDDFKYRRGEDLVNIIYIDVENPNVELMQEWQSITSFYSIESVAIDGDADLTLPPLEIHQPLSSLTIDKRFHDAHSLVSWMKALKAMPIVYQMRRANVFSFAYPFVNDTLSEVLYHEGIKRHDPIDADDLEDVLVGCLLDTDKQNFIIIQDYRIGFTTFEEMRFEDIFIKQSKVAGIRILNIDTSTLISSPMEAMEPIIQSIKIVNPSRQTRTKYATV